MSRWGQERTHLWWLRPGLGLKRWLLLLIAGLILLVLGVAALSRLLDLSAWWRLLERSTPWLPVVLFFTIGGILIALAIVNLSRELRSAFRHVNRDDVVDAVWRNKQRQRGPKIVAIGGGHGLNTLLRGLKEHTDNITAIVTVADDGGSSGKLRRDLGMLPPGDFRNCLAALSDAEGLVSQLFQYRFGQDSGLDGHSFGNLYLTAMTAITGSFLSALAESSRVLAVRGRVIPSTLAQVVLGAEVMVPGPAQDASPGQLRRVQGESMIGELRGQVQRVYLEPEDAPAYPEAIRAILDADLIVIGPGSLYTSVLPNLLVQDLARAVSSSTATKAYVCNVATQAGETEGYDVSAHVHALHAHVGRGLFHFVLANHTFTDNPPPGEGADWTWLPEERPTDYELVTGDLVDRQYPWRHDPAKLARALIECITFQQPSKMAG
jgi:uncharacterized cofD-like protein